MAARLGHRLDDRRADLRAELDKLDVAQALEVRRSGDGRADGQRGRLPGVRVGRSGDGQRPCPVALGLQSLPRGSPGRLEGPGYGWVAAAGTDGEPWIALAQSPTAPAPGTATGTLTWQRVPTAPAIAGGGGRGLKLRYLSTVPGGLLTVGGDVRGAVVLSSPDGVQWTRARDNAAFDFASVRAVAGQGGMLVAVGARSGSNRGLLWTTTDGLTWRDGGYAFAGNIEVVGVAAGAGSFAVAGSFRTPADASGLRRLGGGGWGSVGGATWDRFVLPSDADPGDFRLTFITFAGSRFVALGRASDTDAHPGMLVWTSTDGRAWRRGQDIATGRNGSIADIALGPSG